MRRSFGPCLQVCHSFLWVARPGGANFLLRTFLAFRGKRHSDAFRLWVSEDLVIAKSSPTDRRVSNTLNVSDGGPLPRSSAVGSAEAPRHFEHAGSIDDRLHSQLCRPRRGIVGHDELITRIVELPGRLAKELSFGIR